MQGIRRFLNNGRTIAALAVTALLGACADPSGIAPAARPLPPSALGLRSDGSPTDWPAGDWWRRFRSPTLDALVERALADSPTVALAAARVARSTGAVASAEAAGAAQVGGVLDMTHQRYTENGMIPKPLAGSVRTSNLLQLNLGWELDVFGRQRAMLDAALGQARAAQADLQAARVLLAAQVARHYFELARCLALRDLAAQNLAQQQQIVVLTQQRVEAGLDSRARLRQAEASPPEIHRQIAALDERIALARHALAALTVQAPDALAGLQAALPEHIRTDAPTTIPVDLIGRRADVVAARWRIEAMIGERDLAVTQFYPNVNLLAFAGLSSLGFERWLDAGSVTTGAGPAIRLPLFDGGRLRANLRIRTADIDAAIHSYHASIVEAAREVADQIAALQSLGRQTDAQRNAQTVADDALGFAEARARAGLDNRLSVLQARSTALVQRSVGVELRTRALDLDVALARALGGGAVFDAVAAH